MPRANVRVMRYLILIVAFALSGCVTTLSDIREREVQDDVVTARALPEVRDCLLQTVSYGRTPIVTGNGDRTEIVFQTGAAGAIFHYVLTATDSGTRVEARRKNNIADGFNAGRACYPAN
jgi:hypothetical protein